MIFIFFILTFFLFLYKSKDPYLLTKKRSDVLKALFPFSIIIGHVYFQYPYFFFQDFRWAGPYVVGGFFFMSGYGLEYKYEHAGFNLETFKRRILRLFIPVVPPLIIYLLVRIAMGLPLVDYILEDLRSYSLVLPMTWFVISLFFLYLFYYIGRCLHLSNKVHNVSMFFLITILAVFLIKVGMSGTTFESNYAFLCGIIFKQKEYKIIRIRRGIVFMLSLMFFSAIAFSYIHNLPPFRGFATIGVIIYVWTFFYLFSFVPIKDSRLLHFLKSISYELYLCQGILFLILSNYPFPWYVFLTLLLFGDIVCAWICQDVTDMLLRKIRC